MLLATVEHFDAHMSVNVRGVFLAYKHAALQMIKQGKGGRLIAASSICGRQGYKGVVGYGASKFAVRGVTQTAAAELRSFGITANAYAPGMLPTPLILSLTKDEKGTGVEKAQLMCQQLGMGDNAPIGTPDLVAGVVSFLVKPESYFISGQTLTVDGGIVPS